MTQMSAKHLGEKTLLVKEAAPGRLQASLKPHKWLEKSQGMDICKGKENPLGKPSRGENNAAPTTGRSPLIELRAIRIVPGLQNT